MSVKVRENKGFLFLDIYVKGKRKWENLNVKLTDDKAHNKEVRAFAELCRQEREIEIARGAWNFENVLRAKTSLYDYMKTMGEKRDKEDRVNRVLYYLEKYPDGLTIQIGQVNSKWFSNFQDYLAKDTGLSPCSADSYALGVRLALKQAVREKIIATNPAENVKGIKVPETDKDYLTFEELQHLAKVNLAGKLGAEVKRAFIFACYCGLRESDIKSLTWKDIESKTNGFQIRKTQIKTGRKVIVPLHESAWKIINDNSIHNRTEPVFPLLSKTNTNTVNYIKRWVKQAGIEKRVGWHTARRTYPSLLQELGVDIYTTQKLLGHSKIQTTALYTKVSDNKLRQAVDVLPGIVLTEGSAQ